MLSVVIPMKDERENVGPLLEEIAALASSGVPLEDVVCVDDGSTDGTTEILKECKARYPFLKIVRHDRSAGQSAATLSGVRTARGELVATMDGDGQNDPADVKLLFDLYKASAPKEGPIMVMGQRRKRNDSLIRILSSRIANRVRSFALKDDTRDTGCSLKLFRREDYLRLPYFNHMHRFLPALMKREGVKTLHVDVSHRPRLRGTSKYGTWGRLKEGVVDLLGVMWLLNRGAPKIVITEE